MSLKFKMMVDNQEKNSTTEKSNNHYNKITNKPKL